MCVCVCVCVNNAIMKKEVLQIYVYGIYTGLTDATVFASFFEVVPNIGYRLDVIELLPAADLFAACLHLKLTPIHISSRI